MFPTLCGSLLPRLTSVLYPQSNFKEIKSQALLSTCFVPGPQLGAWGKHHTIVSTAILGEGLINPILQRGKPKLREVPWLDNTRELGWEAAVSRPYGFNIDKVLIWVGFM